MTSAAATTTLRIDRIVHCRRLHPEVGTIEVGDEVEADSSRPSFSSETTPAGPMVELLLLCCCVELAAATGALVGESMGFDDVGG